MTAGCFEYSRRAPQASNVCVTDGGRVFLSDLGAAKKLQMRLSAGPCDFGSFVRLETFVGSPAAMAPVRAQRAVASGAVLCCTLSHVGGRVWPAHHVARLVRSLVGSRGCSAACTCAHVHMLVSCAREGGLHHEQRYGARLQSVRQKRWRARCLRRRHAGLLSVNALPNSVDCK